MSLTKILEGQKEGEITHATFTAKQDAEYLERQGAFIKTLFGPLIELATKKKREDSEVFVLYATNNSGLFADAYGKFAKHPKFEGADPTYEAGMAILIRTYARLRKISELKAGLMFLERGMYEAYDQKFNESYKPFVQERLALHNSHIGEHQLKNTG